MAPSKRKPQGSAPPQEPPRNAQQGAGADPGASQQQAPISEGERIKHRKLQVITAIQKRCSDPLWVERLLKIAHGDESKIMRALNNYSTFIANDQGAGRNENKRYVCEASLSSLFSCFLEAFQLGLDIGGGRDLVAIIVYGQTAELEVTYKGFVNALSRHFDNPFVQTGLIFKDDVFEAEITDSKASFVHKPKSLLAQTWEKLEGAFCYFSYTLRENKQTVSRLVVIDKAGIAMIRSKAKSQNVWNDFWGEMVIKAVCRRASKIPFASIDFDEGEGDPAVVDNKYFLLEDNSGDRLTKLMERQREILDDDKPPEGKPAEGAGASGQASGAQASPNASPEAPQGQGEASAENPDPPGEQAVRFTDDAAAGSQVIENETKKPELTDDDFERQQ